MADDDDTIYVAPPHAAHAQLQNRLLANENGSNMRPASRRKNLLKESAKDPPRRPLQPFP
jgi:hypothetical protein